MGKDFRVGLITGVVLAGAALLWVATRPSLSPQARIPRAPQAAGGAEQTVGGPPAVGDAAGPAEANEPQTSLRSLVWLRTPPRRLRLPVAPLPVPSAADIGRARRPHRTSEPDEDHPTVASATQDLTIYETNEPIKTTRFHIVRKGETLSSIAQQYYGAAGKWRKILTANAKTVKNPNKIAPGTKLIIPD